MEHFTNMSNNNSENNRKSKSIELVDIQKKDIFLIKPLWEKLNKMHYDDSVYFKEHYSSFTFEERIESLLEKNDNDIKITILKHNEEIKGYCISTINNKNGEIDSIYLEKELQGSGFGKKIVNQHIKWLKENNCKKIRVAVSYGHNAVIEFYHKLGFYERMIYLELKK